MYVYEIDLLTAFKSFENFLLSHNLLVIYILLLIANAFLITDNRPTCPARSSYLLHCAINDGQKHPSQRSHTKGN